MEPRPRSDASAPRIVAALFVRVLLLFALLQGLAALLAAADLVAPARPELVLLLAAFVVLANALTFLTTYGFWPGLPNPDREGPGADKDPNPARRAARERWLALPEGERPPGSRSVAPDRSPDAPYWGAQAAKAFVGSATFYLVLVWLLGRGKGDPVLWGGLVTLSAVQATAFRL